MQEKAPYSKDAQVFSKNSLKRGKIRIENSNPCSDAHVVREGER